jgi:hypothetical protein
VLTSRGTFQKYYTQTELRQTELATNAIPAAPGVFYVVPGERFHFGVGFPSRLDRRAGIVETGRLRGFRGTDHPRRWGVTMKTLIVRHVDQSDPAQFQVVRLPDGKTIGPVVVPSPVGFPVAGRPNSDLMRELRWYLEGFLDYPFTRKRIMPSGSGMR